MLRSPRLNVWGGVVLILAAAIAPTGLRADEVDERLQAGEFSTLVERSKQLPSAERDRLLGRLAVAQSVVGERAASMSTLAQVSDDRVRTDSLNRIAATDGARGGGVEPDFEALMELIESTVAPVTWVNVGGAGSMEKFPGGVLIDAQGMLRPRLQTNASNELAALHRSAAPPELAANSARRSASLRKVSLTRLEKELQLRCLAGLPPTDEMALLAGLRRVEYVLFYPDTRDVVLAGPAGDWTVDAEGRIVADDSGRPVLRLDDLVVLLRTVASDPTAEFGCAITPTTEGLAKIQEYVAQSSRAPLKPGLAARTSWLKGLAAALGPQTIEVFGIEPGSRVAQVMVEADYRMKCVGIGLEPGGEQVPSYLHLINLRPGDAPPPMDVLRWWFTPNYPTILASADQRAFALRGPGVQVLSETELLEATGRRVHTGQSHPANAEFARKFTENFADLAARYPVYAELENVFDLALVSALLVVEGRAEQIGWHMSGLLDPRCVPVARSAAPQKVDSIVNHRMVGTKTIVAAVSGGVTLTPARLVADEAMGVDGSGRVGQVHQQTVPPTASSAWWWD